MLTKQFKLTSANFYQKAPDIAEAVLAADDPLHDMLRLAGLPPASNVLEDQAVTADGITSGSMSPLGSISDISAAEKKQLEREHKIKTGSDAWFRLWFAKESLTGETPIAVKQSK